MDETLTTDLKKQFQALPKEVQQAISAADLPTKLQEIVKNNKLMIDQAGGLEIETTLVLFGLEPLENYVANLIKNVGLSSIQASVVAHDVNESIFKNIRETLKKINEQIAEENKKTEIQQNNPTKEQILAGIEKPETLKNTEQPIGPIKINIPTEVHPEMAKEGIEIKINNNLPEIAPEPILPMVSSNVVKSAEPIHVNIPPVQNIVESKLTNTVATPKETIIIEEKTKLPEKSKPAVDPYRELPM